MNDKDVLELNTWIAEHVMGVKPAIESAAMSKDRKGYALWEKPGISREIVKDFCERTPEYDYVENKIYPNYSKNPAAAMQVLEKCAEKLDGFEVSIGLHVYKASEPARFMVCSSNHREFQSIAETLPLAICLFAKKLFSKP